MKFGVFGVFGDDIFFLVMSLCRLILVFFFVGVNFEFICSFYCTRNVSLLFILVVFVFDEFNVFFVFLNKLLLYEFVLW